LLRGNIRRLINNISVYIFIQYSCTVV